MHFLHYGYMRTNLRSTMHIVSKQSDVYLTRYGDAKSIMVKLPFSSILGFANYSANGSKKVKICQGF